MSKFRARLNAFFYQHRDSGIPNLMLLIGIANVVVYALTQLNPNNPLFQELFAFHYEKILHGQVWRLISYPLNYLNERGLIWGLISLLFYFYCGRVLEEVWGRLRFNCYYLLGILLTDAAALLIGLLNPVVRVWIGNMVSAYYVNLSLFLAVATIQPDAMVRVYFVIPVKMKWLAWLDIGLSLFEAVSMAIGSFMSFLWLMPLVAILNYLLFFGKQAKNILPDFLRYHPKLQTRQQAKSYAEARRYNGPIRETRPYRFKCTVCGRTDVSHPNLEFRYCSRCAGYRCYCIDHINNHSHITE